MGRTMAKQLVSKLQRGCQNVRVFVFCLSSCHLATQKTLTMDMSTLYQNSRLQLGGKYMHIYGIVLSNIWTANFLIFSFWLGCCEDTAEMWQTLSNWNSEKPILKSTHYVDHSHIYTFWHTFIKKTCFLSLL